MRRTILIAGAGLCIWQIAMLVVEEVAVRRDVGSREVELPADEARLLASLIHASAADLQASVDEVSALRQSPRPGRKEEPSEVALVAALQSGDIASARRQRAEKAGPLPDVAGKRVDELLGALAQRPDDLGLQTALALELSSFRYRHGGLEAWAWQLWDRAREPLPRARIAQVLSVFHDGPKSEALHRAALRFAGAAGDPSAKEYVASVMVVGQDLAESGRRPAALALFREAERLTQPGPVWGPAVFNQVLLLHQLGYEAESRVTAERLIASTVDDREPGTDLLRTNRNYRHNAANLVADSYRAVGAFPLAYRWRLLATDRYRFYSWCGTCIDAARCRMSFRLFGDAALAGPAFLAAHMVLHPMRSWLAWGVVLAVAAVTGWLVRRRRARRAALQP